MTPSPGLFEHPHTSIRTEADAWRERILRRFGEKAVTGYWRKPIPTDAFDWGATTDNYDGAPDAGYQPHGFGRTEAEALCDLADDLEERADA